MTRVIDPPSKHEVTDNDGDTTTVYIMPDQDPKMDPGWRYRVDREGTCGPVFLSEEQVLPERVSNPKAQRIIKSQGTVWLNRKVATWLRDVLTEIINNSGEDW